MAGILARHGPCTALQQPFLHPRPRPPVALTSPIVLLGRSSYTTKARAAAARAPKTSTEPSTRSPPPHKSPTVDLQKIETLPFLLTPSEALLHLDAAGSVAFGLGAALNLAWTRFLARFGIRMAPKVKRVATQAVLLPVWRVDLATRGKVSVDKKDKNLHITADMGLPGFSLDPLHRLPFRFPHSGRFELYDPKKHSEQLLEAGHAITTLPFEMGPLNLLAKLAAMPKLSAAKHGFGLDPSHFDTYMFAAYPLYLPFYLGEFEIDGKRASAAIFGAPKSNNSGTAIFRTYQPSPHWQTQQLAIEVNFFDHSNNPYFNEESVVRKLRRQRMQLLKQLNEPATSRPGVGGAPRVIEEVLDRLPQDEATWLSNPRVMRFSKNAEANREYVETETGVAEKEAIVYFTRRLPDPFTASVLTKDGPKKFNRDQLLAVAERDARKARKAVALSKPGWVDKLEQAKSARATTLRSRASRGR